MSKANWSDLRARTLSGLAMLALGGFAIWQGGYVFGLLAVVVAALMIWELASMTAPGEPRLALGLAGLAGATMFAVLVVPNAITRILLLVPVIAGSLLLAKNRLIYVLYSIAIMGTGLGLIVLRTKAGVAVILWIVTIVVVSDVAGYFAGRALGGPKFWPRFSPKKTWSGTVAGWIGAVAVGALFVAFGWAGWGLLWLSPLLAFSGQLGDIAESAIKRRMGVKDSSNLIPGHGGVLDRFDALIGGVVFLHLVVTYVPLPFVGS